MPKKYPAARLAAASGLLIAIAPGAAMAGASSVAAQSTGTTFLAASNTEPAFDFMTQDFVQDGQRREDNQFQFRGSGHLAGEMDGGVDYAVRWRGQFPRRLRTVRISR